MSDAPRNPAEWWGSFTIPHGRAGYFQVGSLGITVSRLVHEWQIARERLAGVDADADEVQVVVPVDAVEPKATAIVTRYATTSRGESISIVPVLPDRPVITRPQRPITILPRTHVTLFMGSPVWMRFLHGQEEILGDLPVHQPKEAWVGPSTREGEFCYATRTHGRLAIDQALLRPHRVMTAVTIRNEVDTPFLCDRFNLPTRILSVYAGKSGRLWTEAVTLARANETGFAKLMVESGAPRDAQSSRRLSGPRDPVQDNGLFRAFGAFFG